MPTIRAAPPSSARLVAPSHEAELPIWPGARMVWMITALPATSRPTKSASVPSPTHTASAVIGSGMESERVAGLADPKVRRSSPLSARSVQSVGNHCGPRSNSTWWMLSMPSSRNRSSVHSAVIRSYGVPEMRPQ